jgi:hypothetical protein
MARIVTNTTSKNLPTKSYLNNQGADLGNAGDIKNVNDVSRAGVREPDFAELHALFEIDYEQFIKDTSDEIEKRTQRIMELKLILYGNPSYE